MGVKQEPYGTGWLFRVGHGSRVGIVVDEPRRQSYGIRAWVELHLLDEDAEGRAVTGVTPIHFGSYDLTGARTVKSLLDGWQVAGTKIPLPEPDVATAVYRVIEAFREGPGRPEVLSPEARDESQPPFLIEPLWGGVGSTRLIAVGGSGKSFLAMGMALQVAVNTNHVLHGRMPTAHGPVVYLDWEADRQTHADRLSMIAKGAGIPAKQWSGGVLYLDMRRHGALYRSAAAVARQVQTVGAVAVVVDSVMMARGSSGEGPAEESSVRMFEAIDQIGVPALLIDHKSKAQAQSKNRRGGYGSVVMDNAARNVWDMTRSFPTSSGLRMELEHTKANNTRRYPVESFELTFADGALTFEGQTPLDGWGQNVETVEDRIVRALIEHGPLSAPELVENLDVTETAVRKALSRTDRVVVVATGSHNRKLYGLADDAPVPLRPVPTEALPDPY